MMKERAINKKWCWAITAVLLLSSPIAFWLLHSEKQIDAWVIDKTLPAADYREHRGLFWVLNHFKIVNQETKQPFVYNHDYYGFFPEQEGQQIRELPDEQVNPELIYIADTYGVYSEDLAATATGERSQLVYGGLSNRELFSIRQNLAGNTLIAEFNSMASPTSAEVRQGLEEMLGVRWQKWNGRFFFDLGGNEVPQWVINLYETTEKKKWDFAGAGFVLVGDDNRIIVLEDGQDVGKDRLTMQFVAPYAEEYGSKKPISYSYWFEWVEPSPTAETIARFSLDLTASGRQKLEAVGLKTEFAGVVRTRHADYTSYYFAGDFADRADTSWFYQYQGLARLKQVITPDWPGITDAFYWKMYVPMMKKILDEIEPASPVEKTATPEVYYDDGTYLKTKIEGSYLQLYQNNKWQDWWIKGVNLGTALPGKWFTEFPQSSYLYLHWLEQIAAMNVNTVRIYTLLDPEFYDALLVYNQKHPDKPVYLLQEIWPEENPPEDNLLKQIYIDNFNKEIANVIDAVHGKADIAERKGRAYGKYESDVSTYVLAYLVGRELEAEEVQGTDEQNRGYTYNGRYYSVTRGTPTEAFLARACDYTLEYEEKQYKWQHPTAIVSWPTLDPLTHDSEWNEEGDKSREFNDLAAVDIGHIDMSTQVKGGLFGAYHIYPNYPDFMNNEPAYDLYHDKEGRLRYGGYLKEFMQNHRKYPALVAEYGLATGTGIAHYSPDGYHHGGMTEKAQGEGIVRMTEAIYREGYMGAVIFEWMDEWAKKTWITEPLMIPYENHVFWHNTVDPEQNYGILANESIEPEKAEYVQTNPGMIAKIAMKRDASYLYLDITTADQSDLDNNRWLIGLDTYAADRGDFLFPSSKKIKAPAGMEFMIELKGQEGKLLAVPEYNIGSYRFASSKKEAGQYEEIKILVNKARVTKDGRHIPAVYHNASMLNYGSWEDRHTDWTIDGSRIRLRIPWGRLNISNPATYQVLDDTGKYNTYPDRDKLKTAATDGLRVFILAENEKNEAITGLYPGTKTFTAKPAYLWQAWGQPEYQKRLKESYKIIQQDFASR